MSLIWKSSFTPPVPENLIYTIDTTEGGTRPTNVDFTLRATNVNASYDVTWGDGTSQTGLASDANLSHTYATPGTYTVEVSPSGVYQPYFNNQNNDADLITTVYVGEAIDLGTSFVSAFRGADRMTDFECVPAVTSNVTDFSSSWQNCIRLTPFPLIDTSSATSFSNTWNNCWALTSFPLIDTSSATNFFSAWSNCTGLTTFPEIDTSSATNFNSTWFRCFSLTSFPLLNTSNVTAFSSTWNNCSGLTSFPLIDTSNATNLTQTWFGCSSLTTFPLIDVTSVTTLSNTWRNCTGLTSFPLLNTSSIQTFSFTWMMCSSLTSFPLINTSAAINFSYTWFGCSSLTSFPTIDISNVTNCDNTWNGCTSLTSFPLLNPIKVTLWQSCWQGCTSLVTFPANFFDNWTATPANNCFANTWDNCSSLSATSVENILNSIDTSGRSAPASGVDITIDYNAASGTPNISTPVSNLKSRDWTITLNGVLQ